ncbi:hypothetical protein PDJAM_G00151250 [Pangasius djambal]|uniref:Uncharacterized protein n=1 Tax=Pangasius djambal TaxID=1691987 RepID=A0ACC5ZHA9_9TELE|nr:hypothetical protein [Pangasius djambal]
MLSWKLKILTPTTSPPHAPPLGCSQRRSRRAANGLSWLPETALPNTRGETLHVLLLFLSSSRLWLLFSSPLNLDLIQPLEDFNPPFNAPLANYVSSSGLKDVITGQCQECVLSSEDSRRAGTGRWSSHAARMLGLSLQCLGFIVVSSDHFRDKTDARLCLSRV